jgi:hypothetical protein
MRVLNAIAAPLSHSPAESITKKGPFNLFVCTWVGVDRLPMSRRGDRT